MVGHFGSDSSTVTDRIERFATWGGYIGENIAYGEPDGVDYIMQLYIDDGGINRGHRKNIVDQRFKVTGIASCKHTAYTGMLVIVYAGVAKPRGTTGC